MRLRRSAQAEPGISRVRRGRGFSYHHADGTLLGDDEVQRVRALGIPPAWTGVWICADPAGHLQAVGVDSAGRLQYLYHPLWRQRRDLAKFERMVRFGDELPRARRTVSRHLAGSPLDREAVLACAFRLLDATLIRIGGEQYAATSGAQGLATLRRASARVTGDVVQLRFTGKSAVRTELCVDDPGAVRVLSAVSRAGAQARAKELLGWREGRRWRDVRTADVNAYVKQVAGDEFSAKDFRTWHATVTVADVLLRTPPPGTPAMARRAVAEAVTAAAQRLGNTPTVARSSYVDPRLVDAYTSGRLAALRTRSPEAAVRSLLS